MAGGAFWMVFFKTIERSLGLISTLVLARLLMPGDFGIVAMAISLIGLLELFSAFGLDTVLIQHRETTRQHFDTAWTMNALASAAIGVLLFALAVPAAQFYAEPRLVPVILVFGLGAIIQGLENVGVVEFRKELHFAREFRFLLVKRLIQFAITIVLAFALRNYWALALGTVAGRCTGVVLSYAMHPYRPRFHLGKSAELMHFSKWLLIQNVLTFLKERSATFIMGRTAGPTALGEFTVSAELANMPAVEMVAPINRAVLPAYVKLAHDPAKLASSYLSVMSGIALLAVPLVAGMALAAPYIVLLVLGPKWLAAIELLQVLAFFGIIQVLQSNAYSALIALGKPEVFARINAYHIVVLVTTLLLLTPSHGSLGAAWAYVITAAIMLPINFAYIIRFVELRTLDLVRAIWRPIVASIAMYLFGRQFGPQWNNTLTHSVQAVPGLTQVVAMGAGCYGLVISLLWLFSGRPEGAETWLLRVLRNGLQSARTQLQRRRPT